MGRATASVRSRPAGDVPASRRTWAWVCPPDSYALDGATGEKGLLAALAVACLACLFCLFPLQAGAESPDLDVLWPLRTFHKWPVCPLRESLGAGGTFTPEPV